MSKPQRHHLDHEECPAPPGRPGPRRADPGDHGSQGLGWEGDDFEPDELDAVRGWLSGKATTIFGGSQEIQNNIISKRILGLLDTINGGLAAPAFAFQ